MGRYKEEHEKRIPAVLPIIEQYRTKITDKESEKTAKSDWEPTRTKANEKAWKKLKENESCCYITTACLENIGVEPQNSLELQAMKVMTKEHILKTREGKRNYILYQRKAPQIVSVIQTRSDQKQIWERVYERLQDITRLVFGGRYEEGYKAYKELVNELDA